MSESTPTVSTPLEPVDTTAAIWQLRTLVGGLGAMLLVLSVTFNLFIWKQNRNISSASNGRKQQLMLAEGRLNELARIANDLATYSGGKPELVAIFTRHGMELKEQPAESALPEPENP